MRNSGILTILIAVLLLSSCSQEKRIGKKVNKLGAENVLAWLQKNRKDLFIVRRDTIRDTVMITAINKDTVFKWSVVQNYDTVTITKDRLKVKVIKLPGDTVKIEGECAGDTVYINKPCPPVAVPKEDFSKRFGNKMFIIFPILLVGIILLLLFLFLFFRKKY